ncbi:MAG: twin-arginine translocation signal domain-containing protein [Rhodopirellula sp.]|nr:twin-arginine translocation signal domain-containing protein [Rhodopirellula sp.]
MCRHCVTTVCSRRQFLSGCAACAGSLAGGALLRPHRAVAVESPAAKPKIRLVFCETSNDKPIWPNVGYDFDARRKRLIEALTAGCPDVQLLETRVMDKAEDAAAVLQKDDEVDGYLVCLQGLGWRNDAVKLCTTGKPTLLVDNLFGGSGLFLLRLPQIMSSGKPVDWVSSSDDQDIVAAARCFASLKQGKPPADVVAAFRAARRERTPAAADWTCRSDAIPQPNFDEAMKRLRQAKLLVVGGGWGGDPFRKAAEEVVGVKLLPISFEELSSAYAAADRNAGRAFADRWSKAAEEVVEPGREDLEKSGRMYVAMKQLLEKHDACGISINCLGGFYGGHMEAYPCLGFSQLNNDGLVGGCEADQMSALTMATMGALVGRPGYISDPVIDTSKNQIIYAHCVAMTKPFGPEGASNPYRIRNHSEDRKGVAIQSLLPEGYMTTTLEINPVSRQVLFHQAKSAGNNPSDMACRTKLEGIVKGDIEKLTETWRMGWHRVTFYGDLKEPVAELCSRLKLELIEEA